MYFQCHKKNQGDYKQISQITAFFSGLNSLVPELLNTGTTVVLATQLSNHSVILSPAKTYDLPPEAMDALPKALRDDELSGI